MGKKFMAKSNGINTRQIRRKLKAGDKDIFGLYDEFKKEITPFLNQNQNDKIAKLINSTMHVIDEEIEDAKKSGIIMEKEKMGKIEIEKVNMKKAKELKTELKVILPESSIEKYNLQLIEIKNKGIKANIK